MVTVFLVDDHEVVRRGLIDLLSADPDLQVIGEAGTVAHAMAQIPALRPDVAVLDVRLPDGNGIELCRDLLSRLPELRCLMLTSFTSDEAMLDAVLAGASGWGSSGHHGSPRRAPEASLPALNPSRTTRSALSLYRGRCGDLPAEGAGRDPGSAAGEGFPPYPACSHGIP